MLDLRSWRSTLEGREVGAKDAAAAETAPDVDVAFRLLHDAVNAREPEPGALSGRLRREEGFEEVSLRRLIHPYAGVGHFEQDVKADVCSGMGPDEGFREHAAPHRDAQRAARRHRVAGVCGEVEQDLLDLDGVGENQGHLCVGLEADDDGLPNQPTQECHRVTHDGGKIESCGVHVRSAAERQQTHSQLRGALGGMFDLEHIRPARVARRVLGEVKLGESANGGQEVVEVVGHSTRELADRFHLLGRCQLLLQGDTVGFGPAPFTYVASDAQHSLVAAQVDDGGTYLDWYDGSVLPHVGGFEEGRSHACERVLSFANAGRKLRWRYLDRRHCQELVTTVAKPLARGSIYLDELAANVVDEDGVAGEVEQGPEAFFRLAQGLLGRVSLRDVLAARDRSP